MKKQLKSSVLTLVAFVIGGDRKQNLCHRLMPVEKRRSFAFERMISEKFVCSHPYAGCGGEFLTKEELSAHEQVCLSQPVATARPLVILDLERRYLKDGFDREAINSVLDKVGDRPIVVFCVSGPAREGKSYFLNQVIAYAEAQNVAAGRPPSDYTGFLSGKGREPVTVGIQLWSEPLIQRTPRGEIAVLLIDTQGLADMQTTARHNAMLFTFSCSLASVMIHNQFSLPNKLIDESALKDFDIYSTLAQGVLESFNSERSAESKLDLASASKLLFLRRDFKTASTDDYALGLHSENEKPDESQRNFYQDVFDDRSTGSEQRDLLKNIQKHFSHISAYLLPSPGDDFPNADPKPGFIQHMEALMKMLMSEGYLAQEEKIKSDSVAQFKEIVASLEELFQSRDKYFVQATTEKELQSSGLLMTQINSQRETWAHEANDLLKTHKVGASDEVLQMFFNKFATRGTSNLRDLGLGDKFLEQWREFCEGWYANLKKRNELQASACLTTLINSEKNTLTQKAHALLLDHTEGASDEILKEFVNKASARFDTAINKFKHLGPGFQEQFQTDCKEFCEGLYANVNKRNEFQANNCLLATQINSEKKTWTRKANTLLLKHNEGASGVVLHKFFVKLSARFDTLINKFKHLGSGLQDQFRTDCNEFCEGLYFNLQKRNEQQASDCLTTLITSEKKTWTLKADAMLLEHNKGASDVVLEKFFVKSSARFDTLINKFKHLGSGLQDQFRTDCNEFCEGSHSKLKKENERLKYTAWKKDIPITALRVVGIGLEMGVLDAVANPVMAGRLKKIGAVMQQANQASGALDWLLSR